MPRISIESEKESQILEYLARYKYLTISQFITLGLSGKGRHKTYLNTVLGKMRRGRKARIGHIPFSGVYKFQSREFVYYLTAQGANDLVLHHKYNLEDIKRPIGTSSMYDRDYLHRKYFIDVQISLYRSVEQLGYNVPLFDTYYDYTGSSRTNNLRAKTSILLDEISRQRVIPDGLFFIEKNGQKSLFSLELHMGNDTARAMEQIKNHKKTLDIGSASIHYGFTKGNRVLYVFEQPSIMQATIQRFVKSRILTEAYYPYFLFTTYTQIIQDFDSWIDCKYENVSIL